MIYSMTGFGAAEGRMGNTLYKVELRSLNSKGLDVNIKLPNHLKFHEGVLRTLLNELTRGKVDVQVLEEKTPDPNETSGILNIPLMHQYYRQLKQFTEEAGIDPPDILRAILSLPNVVMENVQAQDQEKIAEILSETILSAIKNLNEFRKTEGLSQYLDLENKLNSIQECISQIAIYEPERISKIRERYEKELKNLSIEVSADSGRLEMEMIFYIEKLDINEEKVRLAAHINYFREIIQDKSLRDKGKKLGFLSQEMGREVNTIGSKANHAELQKLVVLMKDDIEKIKEQVNNIL